MSSESCGSSPRLDFRHFLTGVSWVNEEYPEANMALLEGLRSGFTGYLEDNIIHRPSRKVMKEILDSEALAKEGYAKGDGSHQSTSPLTLETLEPIPTTDGGDHLKNLQWSLCGTSAISPASRPNSAPHLRRISALTVRPTIGEERKAWILETRKAYCLGAVPTACPNASSAILCKDFVDMSYYLDATSASCPDFTTKSSSNSGESGKGSDTEDSVVNDPCTYIFQKVGRTIDSSKIRLSPRIEKLDKLIPTTSKEFLNTLRFVNTISPQPSSEQLNIHQQESDSRISYDDCLAHAEKMADGKLSKSLYGYQPGDFENNGTSKKSSNHGRSYKEVFLYGPPQTISPPQITPPSRSDTTAQSYNIRSSACFPSLPKHNSAGSLSGGDSQKSPPPLWSSVLQRSPNSSWNSDTNTDSKSSRTSPTVASSSFVCRFCRASNELAGVHSPQRHSVNDATVGGRTRDSSLPSEKASPRDDNDVDLTSQITDRPGKEEDIECSHTDQESKSDSESANNAPDTDDVLELSKHISGTWIEAKSKGRKRRSTKD